MDKHRLEEPSVRRMISLPTFLYQAKVEAQKSVQELVDTPGLDPSARVEWVVKDWLFTQDTLPEEHAP